MKKVLLLFSGGMDSTLLLAMAKKMGYDVRCLMFDYGQQHVVELKKALELCTQFKVHHIKSNLHLPLASNLIPHSEKTYEGVSPYHVPSRNAIFVTIAAGIAESLNIDLIWLGANYEDREKLFPDCYQEWIYQMNKLLEINGSMKIKLEAPLLGMTKETIKDLFVTYGISENQIHSGYETK